MPVGGAHLIMSLSTGQKGGGGGGGGCSPVSDCTGSGPSEARDPQLQKEGVMWQYSALDPGKIVTKLVVKHSCMYVFSILQHWSLFHEGLGLP